MNNLKLIVLDNIKELGEKVNIKLKNKKKENTDYIVNITASRFSNGEGKVKIEDSIREKDIY